MSAIHVEHKTVGSVTNAYKSIFKRERLRKNLQTDKRLEFNNKDFQALMKEYNINH